jgi:hypothetical protein
MDANFLGSIGMSNGCTIGRSVDSVVVVGDLLRRHCSITVKGRLWMGGECE